MIQPHMFHMGAEGLFQSQWKLVLDHGDSIIPVQATISNTLFCFGEAPSPIGDELEMIQNREQWSPKAHNLRSRGYDKLLDLRSCYYLATACTRCSIIISASLSISTGLTQFIRPSSFYQKAGAATVQTDHLDGLIYSFKACAIWLSSRAHAPLQGVKTGASAMSQDRQP